MAGKASGIVQRASGGAGEARRRQSGFTLIELLITMVILALLMGLALPTYRGHMRKSTRAEAQAHLLAVVARQQQFLLDTRSYVALDALGLSVPSHVSANYTLTLNLVAGPPPGFTLTATPGTDQAAEACGTLSIDHNGTRSAAQAGCW